MGRTYDGITGHLRAWVGQQPMFFVGTAPLAADGHVNLSPKGPGGALRVLGDHRVAYLDIAGSGAETIAHLRENGRIVVMLCAFAGPPRIVRFHGRGEAILPEDPRFAPLLAEAEFADASLPEARRAIIDIAVTRVSDSCGYGVPLMTLEGSRDHHALSTAKHLRTLGAEGYAARRAEANAVSIDGLPALEGA
ncbi:MAG: pyridoxamine 5'-phosphate oxidase family protein [Solirubrobacteraceae bacterium]